MSAITVGRTTYYPMSPLRTGIPPGDDTGLRTTVDGCHAMLTKQEAPQLHPNFERGLDELYVWWVPNNSQNPVHRRITLDRRAKK
jgi:hypothetical protein